MPAVVIRQRKTFRRKNGLFIYFEGKLNKSRFLFGYCYCLKEQCILNKKKREKAGILTVDVYTSFLLHSGHLKCRSQHSYCLLHESTV